MDIFWTKDTKYEGIITFVPIAKNISFHGRCDRRQLFWEQKGVIFNVKFDVILFMAGMHLQPTLQDLLHCLFEEPPISNPAI